VTLPGSFFEEKEREEERRREEPKAGRHVGV
jgi:hypothetical protein